GCRGAGAPGRWWARAGVRLGPGRVRIRRWGLGGPDARPGAEEPEWAIVQRHATGFRFPNGESFLEMQTRVVGTLADLVARHPGRTIVAVSHADPIKAAVAHALGVHLDLFQRITIGTASITVVAYGDGAPRVLTVNAMDGDLAGLVPR